MRPHSLMGQLWMRRDATVEQIRCALADQLPAYARLAAGRQERRLIADLHHSLTTALEHAADDGPNTGEDLEYFRALGRHAAENAFPYADLVASYDVIQFTAMRGYWQVAEQRDYHELVDLAAWSVREVPRALAATIDGYRSLATSPADDRARRQILFDRLLAGADDPGAGLGVAVAPDHLVLVCQPAGSDPVSADRWRRAEAVLTRHPAVPARVTAGRVVALLPVDSDPAAAGAAASDLVAELNVALGPSHAAQAYRPGPAGIPAALDEANEVLWLVGVMPSPGTRVYQADEVLVEMAIARQPAMARRLAAQLDRLEAGTALRETLEALFRSDLDRRRAARALHVSTRTLYYRLERIRALSGLDPASAHGIQQLRAMLTASHLCARPEPVRPG